VKLTPKQAEMLKGAREVGYVISVAATPGWQASRAWYVPGIGKRGRPYANVTGDALRAKGLIRIDPDKTTKFIKVNGFTTGYRYLVTDRKES